jgi:hypothetical protein
VRRIVDKHLFGLIVAVEHAHGIETTDKPEHAGRDEHGKMSFFKTVEGKHTVSTTIYHGVGAKIPIAVFCDVDYLW